MLQELNSSSKRKIIFVTALAIFVVAVVLRVVAATKMAWRPSEINYVDWIGQWFASHFWEYLFQFFHHAYPPQSPAFGNPPFGLWLLSLGVFLAQKLHFSVLFGARMINVLIGSATAVFLFYFGKKWFNTWVGFWAAISFALIPVVVTNNATAYLDTILAFLVLISLELTFRYIERPKVKTLYILGAILGLSILTKLVVIPVVFILWVVAFFYGLRQSDQRYKVIIFTVVLILTPIAIWAGFRDFRQLTDLYRIYRAGGLYPYPIQYSSSVYSYFYIMLLGVMPPLTIASILFGLVLIVKRTVKEKFKEIKSIVLLIAIIGFLTFSSWTARYTTTHQLIAILPSVLVVSALGINQLIKYLKEGYQKKIAIAIVLICLIWPLSSFKPQFWGIYGSALLGGSDKAFRLYSAGSDGEEVPQIAQYIMDNTPKDARIAVVADDWLFPKYTYERTYSPLFLSEGIDGVLARGAEYVVIPRVFLEADSKTKRDFSKINSIYSFSEKGVLLGKFYGIKEVVPNPTEEIMFNTDENWVLEKNGNDPKLSSNNNELNIDYCFDEISKSGQGEQSNIRFILTNKTDYKISQSDGVYFDLFGDGNNKIFQVALREGANSYIYNFNLDWLGWKKVFVPWNKFQSELKGFVSRPENIDKSYKVSIVAISQDKIEGKIAIRNLMLTKEPIVSYYEN